MASVLGYFGFGKSQPIDADRNAVRALPASWYTSQEMYDLERRAIFSRKWILVTHSIRLKNPGDYLRYDVANFQFVLVKDREGSINGFHNICRHRAYPVVEKDCGTAKILSCKYHGWSYGLNGKLAKAPGYQSLEGFDKSQNGLLPIHVHIDTNGFIWVNLDGKETPEIPWEEDFSGMDRQVRFEGINFDDYEFDHDWEMTGDYNWKILSDNYNECYHCATTHPDLATSFDLNAYSVDVRDGGIFHNVHATEEQIAKGLRVAPTYFFPSTSMNVTPHFFFMQRFVPVGPTKSTMRYEVYRNKNSSEEDFQYVNQIYKRVMSEDKVLCEKSQRNLSAGIFVNGEMHPKLEKGPLFFQAKCRDTVTEFHKKEQAAKQQIWPARQQLPGKMASSRIAQADIDFCAGLSCATQQEGMAW